MALITGLEPFDAARPRVHGGIKATYAAYKIAGEKYVQINSPGTATRRHVGETSQTLQFDRHAATALVGILRREFGIE